MNNEDQNKKFSTSPFSCPKSGEDQTKKKKKRSSLRFSTVFGPKLGEGQEKRSFAHQLCAQTFCSSYKRGGGHVAILHILFYANYTILATQKGAMAQWPPLNTPQDGRLWFFSVWLIRSSSWCGTTQSKEPHILIFRILYTTVLMAFT